MLLLEGGVGTYRKSNETISEVVNELYAEYEEAVVEQLSGSRYLKRN